MSATGASATLTPVLSSKIPYLILESSKIRTVLTLESSKIGTVLNLETSLIFPFFLTMLRIRIFFIPDPNFFHSWSRVKNIPGSGSAPKNLSILSQKIGSKLSEISSGMFIPEPDLDFLFIPDPGSSGEGVSCA
jgi:hypothetical protein